MPLGRSPGWTATLAAVGTPTLTPGGAHATNINSETNDVSDLVISASLYAIDAGPPPSSYRI